MWTDVTMQVPPPEPVPIPMVIDLGTLDRLKDVPIRGFAMEIDLFMVPSGVRERGVRSYFPYMLLLVEATRGLVMGFDLLKADPSLQDMWGQVAGRVVQNLADLGAVPAEIKVNSPLLFQLLQPVADQLGLRISQADNLPALEAAREELIQVI